MTDDLTELTPAEQIQMLQNEMVSRATGLSYDDGAYQMLRRIVLDQPELKELIPSFLRTSRDLSQFWAYIQPVGGYADRRKHIWNSFAPLIDLVEGRKTPLTGKQLTDALQSLSLDEVNRVWKRGLDRLANDPEGAITTARTLLETTCKHILDAESIGYDDGAELPKLYRLTAQTLKLAPDQASEQMYKQVLGGCQTVVEGIGSMRNKFSDAHGKGATAAKPDERHARLALNLAASTAMFLVETWSATRN